MRPWQERYVILTNKALRYYKEKTALQEVATKEAVGIIPLINITKAEYLPDKKIGCRFDVTIKNRRVYAWDGATPGEAKQWVHQIGKAIEFMKREEKEKKKEKIDVCRMEMIG